MKWKFVSTIYGLPAFHSHFSCVRIFFLPFFNNVTVKVQFKWHGRDEARTDMRRSISLIECLPLRLHQWANSWPDNFPCIVRRGHACRPGPARLHPNFVDDYETYCVRAPLGAPSMEYVITSEFVPPCMSARVRDTSSGQVSQHKPSCD